VAQPESEIERLQNRFANRLNLALTDAGYSPVRASRAKELASMVGVDVAIASAWLGGFTMPTWEELLEICARTRRRAGFYLDEHVDDLPPGTTVVKCIGAGESLVIRLPTDVLGDRVLRRGLLYYLAPEDLEFGIRSGDYVIAFEPGESVLAEVKKLYLFSLPDCFAVRQCIEVARGRAVFTTQGEGDVPLMRSVAAQGGGHDFSEIFCIVRLGASLLLDD
jgi:hypothetical protein